MSAIAFVRTASRSEQSHVDMAAQILLQQGLHVHPSPMCWQSVSAMDKYTHFLSVLTDPQVDVLWAVRGGEGSADILPLLAQHAEQLAAMPPKILIGSSDFTAILLYFQQHFGWHAIHGPTAASVGNPGQLDDDTIAHTVNALLRGVFPAIPVTPLNILAKTTRIDSAQCTGGNMSLLNISVGDSWQCDPTGNILLIEDWHEKGYVVDRTLKYFERLGWFDQAKALVFGDMQADTHEPYLNTVLQRTAERLTIPVYHTRHIGHGKTNFPVSFNQPYTLSRKGLSLKPKE